MAFDVEDDSEPIGSFMMMNQNKDAQFISCFNGTHNAATHVLNDAKESITLNWMPPRGFLGQVIFKYNFLITN